MKTRNDHAGHKCLPERQTWDDEGSRKETGTLAALSLHW